MRPRITTSRHVARSIWYNEQKVELHVAERLDAANLLKPLPHLTPAEILHRFHRRMELNDRVRTSLHITLNFDPQDTLSNEQMQQITRRYMKEIGFQGQPWIAWRHHDAGHPHCHIVATHVQWNGDPIDLYKIGQNQSEMARQKIENEFKLITKETKQQQRQLQQRINDRESPPRLIYGQQPLVRAISDIVEYVTNKYRYTSLEELNAVLRLYNVEAYRGQPGTKLHQTRGLLYRALDEHGYYIGRPLKASVFDCKPTLNNLERKFVQNLALEPELRQNLITNARWALFKHPGDWDEARKRLRQENIVPQLRLDKNHQCRQVAYIDTRFKQVFIPDQHHHDCNIRAIQQAIDRQALERTQTQSQKHTQRLRQTQRLNTPP
jgi:hypothetical protein